MKVAGVVRDADGSITSAPSFTETWGLPGSTGTLSSPTLEDFRIVLDPAPLNAFLNRPDLAAQAMEGKLSAEAIQEALENDAFSVNTNKPDMPVYRSQEDDSTGNTYGNSYSYVYNQAWDQARTITDPLYTARAFQASAVGPQGANPLHDPQLTLELTSDQCKAALQSNQDLTVTVYYRRNAGFYHVGHWVPKASLSSADEKTYQDKYPNCNKSGEAPFDRGYRMVFLERKQGRVGALTNARANPAEAENILKAFTHQTVNQQTITADTRVDILYDIADRYGLIFQVEGTYIPRQYVNKGCKVTFTANGNTNSGMEVTDSGGTSVSEYTDYKNPTRQGYTFDGWKYEVRSDVAGDIEENGRKYKKISLDAQWDIDENMLSEAVIVRDSDSGNAKMIYLYPVWTPDMANVRVVFWTEDLSGGNKDVDVDVDANDIGGANYRSRAGSYLSGTPTTVGSSFSNVGSFTFMAPTNSTLKLSVRNDTFFSSSDKGDSFTTTGEATDRTGTLSSLINTMFPIRMLDVTTSTGNLDTSRFYYPYRVGEMVQNGGTNRVEMAAAADYTVAPDGSTVINIYYARKVYTLDFTYYGEIKGGSGTKYDGTTPGLAVATNTTGYSSGKVNEPFLFDYQTTGSDKYPKNRWQMVASDPNWTVPQKLSISAKYDADLREVWPLAQGEEIKLVLGTTEDTNLKDVAVFMSWGTTAGPFNQHYRDVTDQESTIIGNYRSMSADIIADPDNTSTVHHLVGYWWNQNQSYYRRNACYEVPGLYTKRLLDAVNTGEVKKFNLRDRALVCDANIKPAGDWSVAVVEMDVTDPAEKTRRDTVYLVPVNSSLDRYFEDYRSNFIVVDEKGEPNKDGGHYAVRCIGLGDNSKVYALGRQATSVSTNYIMAQAPSTMPHMTSALVTYDLNDKDANGNPITTQTIVSVDHDTRTWDNWGRTAKGTNQCGFVALGSAENPYDIWFYYDRARFTIHYMVASRNSSSGEYEIGEHETIYGQNMKRYNLKLPPAAARMYSDDPSFANYWTPADNRSLPLIDTRPDNGLNKDTEAGYTRLCPDSAADGKGAWECKYWSLDRSGSGVMSEDDWNRMVTGNLRVFAQWFPPSYRVKFEFDGGSYNGSETLPIQTVKANVGYTSSGNAIPSPIKDGYVFNGWEWYEGKAVGENDLEKDGTPLSDFTFETPITRDIVLKAKWVADAKAPYSYKIWYLTDEADPGDVTLPEMDDWLTASDHRGEPQPDDPQYADYKTVLGCRYVTGQQFPENTVLSLAAVAIPGYAPVRISTTLTLTKDADGSGAADTVNVAYFYYRKSQLKSYTVQFQLWDKQGEDGILGDFTVQHVIADSTYFTPSDETWRRLKDAGYYLVLMDKDGNVQLDDSGSPIAAKSYTELEQFIETANTEFANQSKGENFVVTFKVAPYFYKIRYDVGAVKRDNVAITPSNTLRASMLATLDQLVAAGKNPTRYVVADFDDGRSFTLTNPAAVKDPDDPSKEWHFTSWSLGTDTAEVSRISNKEYPTLTIERSEGDLEFLANWRSADGSTPPTDPSGPSDPDNPKSPDEPNKPTGPDDPKEPDKPPVGPEKPPADPEMPGSPDSFPTELPDPNSPDAPELITILENGVPTTYRKVWDPETETWVYILEEDVPLYRADVPKTDDDSVFLWALLSILSLSGLVTICPSWLFHNHKKKEG